MTMIEPAPVGHVAGRDRPPDRNAVDHQPLAAAVVGLHEHADHVAAGDPRRRPDPALEPVADHARAAAHAALGDASRTRCGQRGVDMLGAHVLAVDVAHVPVVGLADDREVPAHLVRRPLGGGGRDQRIAHDADRVRVREADARRQEAGLAHPFEAGQLPVAVQAMRPGGQRLAPRVVGARDDHRHAGADGPIPHAQRPVARDQRGVADPDAADIRDRVRGAGWEVADDDPEIARSGWALRHRVPY
jgi:hypothetical protein